MVSLNFKEMDINNNPKLSLRIMMEDFGSLFGPIKKDKSYINPYDLLEDNNIIIECNNISDRKTFIFFNIILNKKVVIDKSFYEKIYPELLLMGFPLFKFYGRDITFKKSKKGNYTLFKDMITYIINSYIFEHTGIEFTDNIQIEIYNNGFN